MSTSYKRLVERAKYGSESAWLELNTRKYVETGLLGIFNDKVVFRMSDEVKEYLSYIDSELVSFNSKGAYKDCILLDSYASATIEGARTTVESVKRAFKHPVTRDDKMVINTIKAQNLSYNEGINDGNIRRIWETITSGVCENELSDGTKYRGSQVYVGSSTKIIHVPEEPRNIEKRMKSLFDFCDRHKDNIVKACIVHFYFVYIHPFCDGNGRFARLWMNVILAGYNEKFKGMLLSREINERLGEYYSSITNSEFTYKGILDITEFIEYMLVCIAGALDYNKVQKYTGLTDLEGVVLSKMSKSDAGITVRKLSSILGVSVSKARTVLSGLVAKRYLIVDKSGREYIYYRK